MTGDRFKRILVKPNVYQCGCRWERHPSWGDVLVQCPIHQQATEATVVEFERAIGKLIKEET